MPPIAPSDQARELLQHFDQLPAHERDRVLRLVRGLRQALELLACELQAPAARPLSA